MPNKPKSYEARRMEKKPAAFKQALRRVRNAERFADKEQANLQAMRGTRAWKALRRMILRRGPLCADPWGHHAEDGRVVVAHLRKASAGQRTQDADPMDSIAGSAQMTAGVRVAAMLEEAKSRDEGVRWFRVVKSNLGPINADGWTWTLTGNTGEMPSIRWDEAKEGMHHVERQRRSNGGMIDEGALAEVLVRRLEGGAQRLAGLSRDVHADLVVIPGQARATRASVEAGIRRLALVGDVCVIGEGARKDSQVVALPGMLPEKPEEKAFRLAMRDPTMSSRQLQDESGCRMSVCIDALRKAKAAVSQDCADTVSRDKKVGKQQSPEAFPNLSPPYKGDELGNGKHPDCFPTSREVSHAGA